jgi:acyl-coenzyme A synthetase/AMP-(fatty) acid ligase
MRVQTYPFVPRYLKEFIVDVPDTYNWGFDLVDRLGREKGKAPALVFAHEGGAPETLTFGDVSDRSSRLANYLAGHGVGRGDPVMLMLSNTPWLWLSVVALMKAGAIVVPAAPTLTPNDLEYRLTAAMITGIITDETGAQKLAETPTGKAGRMKLTVCAPSGSPGGVPAGWLDIREALRESKSIASPQTKATDPALYYFTSGTEGHPKVVVHTHASYPLGHRETALWLGIEPGMLHWNISSPGWAKHAWSSVFSPWTVGAPTFTYAYEGGFKAAKHLERISEFGVKTMCAPPTIWRMFSLEDLSRYDLSSLKGACSAGEPLSPEVIEKFRDATGVTIRDGYGQTETVLVVGNFPGVELRQGSMGVPGPLYDVEIVDERGKILGVGEEGYVGISTKPKPFALFKEYANQPDKTAEVFHDGWYYTGDKASRDADGYFWFIGRSDDVIKSSGYRIGPFEVESALVKHPAVVEAAVIPAPDPVRGAVVKAFVVLRAGYAPSQALADEMAAFVARETAPYKHPRKIEFVQSLEPVKTISGKIRRKNLRLVEDGKAERLVSGMEFTVKPLRGAG